ncbi:MAG: PQQ-binding-like beta-propeller repeat protein, partial [Dokdonella sp.]
MGPISLPTRARILVPCLVGVAALGCAVVHAASGDSWTVPGGDDALSRHSSLTDINKDNAAKLQMAWSMSTGAPRGHEGQPLVIGNMMYYVSGYPNYVYALDLSDPDNYQVVWKYSPKQDDHAVAVACCDTVNRGLAFADGKLVFNTLDGQVIALDAKTGKEIWKVKRVDPKKGETSTPAPIIVKDIVITGMGGDEFGARGRLQAYSLADGHALWTCHSTGD